MPWEQGSHVALVGSTGTGKTTLAEAMLGKRKYVLALLTKSDTLAWRKFSRISRASEIDGAKAQKDGSIRLLLRCPPDRRAAEFRQAIKTAYRQGGWTVYFDELLEMQQLGLEPDMIQLYSEGRSEHVTCVGGMQRPSFVTHNGVSRWALSQPTHIFAFQTRDDRDKKTLRDIVGREFEFAVKGLRTFEFAYLNQRTGSLSTGSVRTLGEVF